MSDRTDPTVVKSLWTEQLLQDLGAKLRRSGNDKEVQDLVRSLVRKNLPVRYLIMKTRKLHGSDAARRLQQLIGVGGRGSDTDAVVADGKLHDLRRDVAKRFKIWYRRNF